MTKTTLTQTPTPENIWDMALSKIDQRNQTIDLHNTLTAAVTTAQANVTRIKNNAPNALNEVLTAARAGAPMPTTYPAKAIHDQQLTAAQHEHSTLTEAKATVTSTLEKPITEFNCKPAIDFITTTLNDALTQLRSIPQAPTLAETTIENIVNRPDDVANWNKVKDLTKLCSAAAGTADRLGFIWHTTGIWEDADNRRARHIQGYGSTWYQLIEHINKTQGTNHTKPFSLMLKGTRQSTNPPGAQPWFEAAADYVQWLRAETAADNEADPYDTQARRTALYTGKRELHWALTAHAGITYTPRSHDEMQQLQADCQAMISAVSGMNEETTIKAIQARQRYFTTTGETPRTPFKPTN